jgi:tRNA(fMet)-specific endonuclease VapC
MSGKYLLDTNIIIALFANDSAVVDKLSAIRHVFVPVIVVGELYYGVSKSLHKQANSLVLEAFVTKNQIVHPDVATAKQYGQIKESLRAAGRPIPENDIWIAALARQHNFSLCTRDQHFRNIKGLKVVTW